MFNLYRADLQRFLKSKIVYTMLILVIVFPLFMGGMYKLISEIAIYEEMPIYGALIDPFGAFMTAFNPVDNFGLIMLILLLIAVLADFNHGTIRNKLVIGYRRETIFIAQTLFILTIVTILVTIYPLLVYAFVSWFLGPNNQSFLDLFRHYLNGLLSNLVIYIFVSIIIFRFKKLGASLGIIIGSLFAITFSFPLLSMVLKSETIDIILLIFPFFNVFMPKELSIINNIFMILINLLYGGGLFWIGCLMSKRQDFK